MGMKLAHCMLPIPAAKISTFQACKLILRFVKTLGVQEDDLKTTCYKWLRAVGPGEFTGEILSKR